MPPTRQKYTGYVELYKTRTVHLLIANVAMANLFLTENLQCQCSKHKHAQSFFLKTILKALL